MAKLKSVLGYIVAALSIPIMLAAALGPRAPVVAPAIVFGFMSATGLKHSANWTGGEVVQTLEHGAYRTEVHRPVFDALIGERKKGFIQVGWAPPDALPARIDEEIDADADGHADFRIELDTATQQASLTPYSPNVIELSGVYNLGDRLAIRVGLKNPRR
jgi:hypothetical protein